MTSAEAPPAETPALATPIPWAGLLAVLMGTFISTLNGRLSSLGIADIRGAMHAGFDEGAWITTAQTAAQMMIAPVAIWLGSAFGPRRILLAAASTVIATSTLIPLSPTLGVFLVLQFTNGVATGFFVPLTLSFILRNTAPRYWAYGVAIYALNLELSLNISASLEGWYADHLSWKWIFWQNVPLAVIMAACLHFGIPKDKPNPARPAPDLFGFASGGVSLALIYAALDQGNRLDWLNSGLVVGLLASGGLLFVAFLLHECRTTTPSVHLRVALAAPLPGLLLLIAFLRLTILSSSYLVPQFLQIVRGYRALEIGHALLWIAAPQLILCPMAAVLLRRLDARLISCIGFFFIAIACLLVSHTLTPAWSSRQFLPSQLLQAVGQSFALSGVLFLAVLHLRPDEALTFGGAIQVARLMGGQLGSAFITTFARVRSQTASNLIGSHLNPGDPDLINRLAAYGALRGPDTGLSATRALGTLAGVVRSASATQGVIDAFVVVAALTALALLVTALQAPAPNGPASHRPFTWLGRSRDPA